MRRTAIILFSFFCIATIADDYVDDTYYSPQVEAKKLTEQQIENKAPSYNKKVKEIVFVEDTVINKADTTQKPIPLTL